jgi:septum formation protein
MIPSSAVPRLILASSSAYRRELLQRLRLPFEAISPDIDETPLAGETPDATALRLAREKAAAIAARNPDTLVNGSHQVATLDGAQIGKPVRAVGSLLSMRSSRAMPSP